MSNHTILWRRLDQPGHESARLSFQDDVWRLAGSAIFTYNRQPCRLDYVVVCDIAWQTQSGRVTGWVGPDTIEAKIAVDSERRWWLNDTEYSEALGCTDLDLNFSPSTNLLPIRRLNLEIGQSAEVKAAWLRFPSFKIEPLDQIYSRIAEATYRYESAGGSFVAELAINAAGFVTTYPNIWTLEAAS